MIPCFLVFLGRYLTRAPRLMTAISLLVTTFRNPLPSQLLDGTLFTLGLQLSDFALIGANLLKGFPEGADRSGPLQNDLFRQFQRTAEFRRIQAASHENPIGSFLQYPSGKAFPVGR